MNEHQKLHLLHIYHIVIQSELKYLFGARVPSLQKYGTGQKTVGSLGFSFWIRYNPVQRFQFGCNPDLELNRQFRTVANATMLAFKYIIILTLISSRCSSLSLTQLQP